MGIVMTLNKINEFSNNFLIPISTENKLILDNVEHRAKTKIRKIDSDIEEYEKFVIEHQKKYNIIGTVQGITFTEILKEYEMPCYKFNSSSNLLIISPYSYDVHHSSLVALKKTTSVKCIPHYIDLIVAVDKIIEKAPHIEIISGQFKELGLQNLQTVHLGGGEVNKSEDWQRFKGIPNVKMSNITFIYDHVNFQDGIKLLLNDKGVFFTHKNEINSETLIKLVEDVLNIINS